jgi:glucuronoarabinoxylan endo-1,4-beta-xylanase
MMKALRARSRRWVAVAALAATAALTIGSLSAIADNMTSAGTDASADFSGALQPIDGFGFSAAFSRAALIHRMPADQQRQIVDLLLSPRDGAGLSILRMGIGSAPDGVGDNRSIEPVDPGSPSTPPVYQWDVNDSGQVWLAEQAKAFGVRRFYADAWSAPPFMKTNGIVANGGQICGLPETSCASGDWRQAYANYLVQYVKFYKGEGIDITNLGFTNEPNFVATYASMKLDTTQVNDMLQVLGPTVRQSGLPLSIVCCDATGWGPEMSYTTAVESDPNVARQVDVISGHEYGSPARSPQPTSKRTWMSEWQAGGTPWNMAWDDGTQTAGITLAEDINAALTRADVSAYIYFFGASTGATGGFIQLDGDQFHVSKRLWAMAAFSRFIRPRAVRVRASAADPSLQISAFRNQDGTRVIEIINTATTAITTRLRLDPGTAAARPTSYVTDTDRSLARENNAEVHGRDLSVQLAPRALTTVVLQGRDRAS